MKTYFWKCCNIEHKLKNGDIYKAKSYLEKHELKVHIGKQIGTFGYYLLN